MTLITLIENKKIVASDINTNFQDQEGADYTLRKAKRVQQSYRMSVHSLTSVGKFLVFKPKSTLFSPSIVVQGEHTAVLIIRVQLICLTDNKVLGIEAGSSIFFEVSTVSGAFSLTTALSGYGVRALPSGFEYQLKLYSASTPIDFADVSVNGYHPRSRA